MNLGGVEGDEAVPAALSWAGPETEPVVEGKGSVQVTDPGSCPKNRRLTAQGASICCRSGRSASSAAVAELPLLIGN
jgi:hypothetical protein